MPAKALIASWVCFAFKRPLPLTINRSLPKAKAMNEYQQEQFEALTMVRKGLKQIDADKRKEMEKAVGDYLQFRQTVDDFLNRYFNDVCTQTCYQSRTSACCSKDGIIVFFADVVVNALRSTPAQLDRLETVLKSDNQGHRCIFLNDDGCMWTVRPVVCALFLCDRAMKTVFAAASEASAQWNCLRKQARRYKWPDRPVLFDDLEKVFIDLGYRSSLMHLNFSPGLLNVKKKAARIAHNSCISIFL